MIYSILRNIFDNAFRDLKRKFIVGLTATLFPTVALCMVSSVFSSFVMYGAEIAVCLIGVFSVGDFAAKYSAYIYNQHGLLKDYFKDHSIIETDIEEGVLITADKKTLFKNLLNFTLNFFKNFKKNKTDGFVMVGESNKIEEEINKDIEESFEFVNFNEIEESIENETPLKEHSLENDFVGISLQR